MALPKNFGLTLLVTFSFSLVAVLLLNLIGSIIAANLLFSIFMIFAFSLIFPIGAWLITKSEETIFLVSLVYWLTCVMSAFFPPRYIVRSTYLVFTSFGILLSLITSLVSAQVCMFIRQVQEQRKLAMTRRSGLIVISFIGIGGLLYLIYVYLELITRYLDQHPWILTGIAIIVSIIITFLGSGKYYERKKAKK